MFTSGLDVVPSGTLVENIHMPNYPSAAQHAPALRAYLNEEVAAGHFLRTLVNFGPIPARTCPVALIPKPDQPGVFCLITDASAPIGQSVNDYSEAAPFRMVNLDDVMARADRHSWGAKTDVKTVFRNLPLNPLHSGLLAIEFEGCYYWELRAPFGWTLAPFSWCRLTDFIQRYCSVKGHNTVVFVDDFLSIGRGEQATCLTQQFLSVLLQVLGLPEKMSKRVTPSPIIDFVGFVFNFPQMSISISESCAKDLINRIEIILSKKGKNRVAHLASLVGKLVFAAQVVHGAHTFTRRLFDAIASLPPGWFLVSLTIRADLLWWRNFLSLENGKKFIHWSSTRPSVKLCTDASNTAAAGVCLHSAWVHAWTNKQRAWHINIKELWSVYHSLLTWSPRWVGHDVFLASDNSAVVSWINSGAAQSTQAMSIL